MTVEAISTEVESPEADARESLCNDGAIGPIKHVQVAKEQICKLRGIFYDLDIDILQPHGLLGDIPPDPVEFYKAILRPMLKRHSLLAKAEVRKSGRGLHAILWFGEPLEFDFHGDRDRWAGIVQVVQAALPIDPDQPGITAVTRPLGSINSKNGAKVTMLKEGRPVTEEEVLGLYEEMLHSPFDTVMKVLTGTTNASPCPICKKEGTKLAAMTRVGQCYGSCGKVKLSRLYDLVLKPRSTKQEAANA